MANGTTKERPSLSLTCSYDASPEEVWRACTDAQALKQWLMPGDSYTASHAEADVRVGGRYRIVKTSADGEQHDVGGVYREIVPNRKLVFTWAWKSTPERESLVTISLRPAGSGTELTLKHEQFFDESARDRHRQGWTLCLAKLEKFLGR